MNDRKNDLLKVRPEIPSAKLTPNMSSGERFQNQTIRPIIKLQNPLLIEIFRNYVNKHKGEFYELSIERKLSFIENAIQKDIKFRNSLKGMIIGQFTVEEYLDYVESSSALNKRMMTLVVFLLQDQVQLFEKAAEVA